jgi:peptidoglycan hydrolase-like protein with peptidoglycan-binding domain
MAMRVQLELQRLGHYAGPINGKIDAATRTAIRSFQQDQGLNESGVMDNATLSKLGISSR